MLLNESSVDPEIPNPINNVLNCWNILSFGWIKAKRSSGGATIAWRRNLGWIS